MFNEPNQLTVLKGCVPVDGDTYEIPKVIATAEHHFSKRMQFGQHFQQVLGQDD